LHRATCTILYIAYYNGFCYKIKENFSTFSAAVCLYATAEKCEAEHFVSPENATDAQYYKAVALSYFCLAAAEK
jgi:hypothetical protein